jgi:beta-galactosidase
MKEEGQVINWFEINTPDGRFSINDTIGDILATTSGKLAAVKIALFLKKAMSSGKKKGEKGKTEVAGFDMSGVKVTKSMLKGLYDMASGFTVKRVFTMIGNGKFTKEQILEVNAILNKAKKK